MFSLTITNLIQNAKLYLQHKLHNYYDAVVSRKAITNAQRNSIYTRKSLPVTTPEWRKITKFNGAKLTINNIIEQNKTSKRLTA